MRGCVWKSRPDLEEVPALLEQNPEKPLESAAKNLGCAILAPDKPFLLDVLKIAKPWGHEGWYTGVEKRGVACVKDEFGRTELPYALGLFRDASLGDHEENLILLKTLNPLPEPVIGDLYLEMHEEKWETYVVTEIDPQAWPFGTGIIKAGIASEIIWKYRQNRGEDWTSACIRDFHERIKEYENIRRKIDALLERAKDKKGIPPNEAVSPEARETLLESIPKDLKTEESRLRKEADTFVGECPVRVGDVVSFPPLQMHSLQHGIRVIEFQTPHYERLIVMFAQKVLTQDHWDTAQALARMKVEPYHPPHPELLKSGNGFREERIVDFPDFVTDRILLEAKQQHTGGCGGHYQLLIVVIGSALFKSESEVKYQLSSEDAIFIHAGTDEYSVYNSGDEPLVFLKAVPKSRI